MSFWASRVWAQTSILARNMAWIHQCLWKPNWASATNLARIYINPFVPNVPFLYLKKTSENRKFFCSQGAEKWYIGNEWVKHSCSTFLSDYHLISTVGNINNSRNLLSKLLSLGTTGRANFNFQSNLALVNEIIFKKKRFADSFLISPHFYCWQHK